MQSNCITSQYKPEVADSAVQRVVNEYLGLSDPQKSVFQRALLNNPEELSEYPTTNVSATTWSDLAKVIAPIEWDWSGWIPRGFLVIVASESGVGKSFLLLRIAASYILGNELPDGTPFEGETGAVLWCEAEAAQALNLERAQKLGLPLGQIYTPFDDPLAEVDLGTPEHRQAIWNSAMKPEVKVIIVDSLRGAHQGNEDASDIISVLKWLAGLARDTGKPVLLTHHLRKRSVFDGNEITIDRLRGSSAIAQLARLIWAIDMPDPKEKDHKRMSVIKSNLSKFPEPIGLRVDETGVHFSKAPEPPKTETQTDRAIDLLMSLLEDGSRPYEEIEEAFEANGISKRTIDDAKKKLGILSKKERKKGGHWIWSLPEKDANVNPL